jgi:hypothetical protein
MCGSGGFARLASLSTLADVHPVKLNVVRPAVINHAASLLGQFRDRIVRFGISNTYGGDEALGKDITRDFNLAFLIHTYTECWECLESKDWR